MRALAEIGRIECAGAGDINLLNMTTAARFVAAAALLRKESRGGHFRSDFPAADEAQATRRSLTLADVAALSGEPALSAKTSVR
jgi:L-aspartate oxidase